MAKKEKKKWPNWLIAILIFSPFIGLFSYGFLSSRKASTELEENAKTTIGEVIRNYRIKSRGDFIVYQFYVGNKLYEDHQPVSGEIKKGTCYMVRYSPKSPANCEIILTKIVPCD